jgi:ferritin
VPSPGTVDELFETAIALEEQAKALYLALAQKFAHEEDVAEFWRAYAQEEIAHARWLSAQKARLDPAILAQPADPDVLRRARRRMEQTTASAVAQIRTLDDAYELAHEIESGETNAILAFMIDHYERGAEAQAFMRAQLGEHMTRISRDNFPLRYASKASRQAIRAR